MKKNRVKLNICGTECIVSSDESEAYVLNIGDEVEKNMKALMERNPRASVITAAVITALSFCDDVHKAVASADNLRSQIKDYLEDSTRSRLEADEARREIERMKKEIHTLRTRLSGESAGAKIQEEELPDEEDESPEVPESAEPPATPEPDADGFMSFFDKKEYD